MPGQVIAVVVAQGARVAAGQKLAAIEAMKMELWVLAPCDGKVADVKIEEGTQVVEGALLLRIEKD